MSSVLLDALIGVIAVATLLLAIAAVWGLFLKVPSMPTPMPVVRTMIDLAHLAGHETILDLGAGDGRLLIEAKRKHPPVRAIGCELNPPVWLLGILRGIFSRVKIELHLRSLLQEDLSQTDVVFLYLFPELLQALTEKFNRELKPGTRIISYMFRLKDREPIETKEVRGYWGKAHVYVYRW
ncbi:MAG TPA: class I SAM-dependent methyltransferase [Candidatus Peribacteraceae bacterium]|nr:class I SAM-dependent methyltransferase [Candidatus Peribacteraceae bacterium]